MRIWTTPPPPFQALQEAQERSEAARCESSFHFFPGVEAGFGSS